MVPSLDCPPAPAPQFAVALGVTRIVAGRELSVRELASLKCGTDAEARHATKRRATLPGSPTRKPYRGSPAANSWVESADCLFRSREASTVRYSAA